MIKEANSFCKAIDNHLSTVHEINDREKNVFHPSFLHHNCIKAIVYDYKGEGDFVVTDPKLKRIFENGHDVHKRVQNVLKECDILIAEEASVKSSIWRISGHCDGIIKSKNSSDYLTLEIKSINQKGFEWALSKGPKKEHLIQIRIYMWILELKQGIIYYECKNDQRHKAWIVDQDENTINEVKNKIISAIYYIDKNQIPEINYNPNLLECRWCNYKEICKQDSKSTNNNRRFFITQ